MRVFITGASGHIGSALVADLLGADHEVIGLARSNDGAARLDALGAEVHRGNLDDPDDLASVASGADGVVHLAFKHELMLAGDYLGAVTADLATVTSIGDALVGTDKVFVTTGGTLMLALGDVVGRRGTEDDVLAGGGRVDTENATIALADRGVRSSAVRLPPVVHSPLDLHGFIPILIGIARATGVAGYAGDGANRWPAVHTLDAARLYRRALEEGPVGARLHCVADEGITFRAIAESIGQQLDLPVRSIPAEDLGAHFGALAPLVALDNPTSSEATRSLLGWQPEHAGLIEDLAASHYFDGATP